MDNASETSNSSRGLGWRLPALLAVVLAAIVAWRIHGLRETAAPLENHQTATASATASRKTVTLVIDFGGGRRKNFEPIEWRDGMTVADLMSRAPDTAVKQKGAGQWALLTAIDGIENPGSAADNWMYSVNGKIADRSFAIYTLQPGDRVLWTFGPRQ